MPDFKLIARMTEAPGPKAIKAFVQSLKTDDPEVSRILNRLHDEGHLEAGAIITALRDARTVSNDHDEASED